MHTITVCPLCHKDFMYHTSDTMRLSRRLKMLGADTSIVICQQCDDNDRGHMEFVSNLRMVDYVIEYLCDTCKRQVEEGTSCGDGVISSMDANNGKLGVCCAGYSKRGKK